MNCNNNQNNNNGCGCNCNPHPTPTPEPVDINMNVCDRNINMLPMLQTYTTKVLKPNIDGCCKKNILKQCMMNCENYKYVIKWDFDLNGQTITVPENCILEFDGGSLKNGTIIGQKTLVINTGDVEIFGDDLIQEGTWRYKADDPEKVYDFFVKDILENGSIVDYDGSYYVTDQTVRTKRYYSLEGLDHITFNNYSEGSTAVLPYNIYYYDDEFYYMGSSGWKGADYITVPVGAKYCRMAFSVSSVGKTIDTIDELEKTSNILSQPNYSYEPSFNEQKKQEGTEVATKVIDVNSLTACGFSINGSNNTWIPVDPARYGAAIIPVNYKGIRYDHIHIKANSNDKIGGARNGFIIAFITGYGIYGGAEVRFSDSIPTAVGSQATSELVEEIPSDTTWIYVYLNGMDGDTSINWRPVYLSFTKENTGLARVNERVNILENREYNTFLSDDAARLKICTWNIGHFYNGSIETQFNTEEDYQEMKTKIRNLLYGTDANKIRADIFSVNEYSDNIETKDGHVHSVINDIFPFYGRSIIGKTKRYTKNAIFSNTALYQVNRYIPVTNIYKPSDSYQVGLTYYTDQYLIESLIRLGDVNVTLVTVHISGSVGTEYGVDYTAFAQFIINRYSGYARVVLLGDFNTYSTNYTAYEEAGFTVLNKTLNTHDTGHIIDNVLYKGVDISDLKVYTEPDSPAYPDDYPEGRIIVDDYPTGISDHYPMSFTITAKIPTWCPVGTEVYDIDFKKPIYFSNAPEGYKGWLDANGNNPTILEQEDFESCGFSIGSNPSEPDLYNKWVPSSNYYGAVVDVEKYKGSTCMITKNDTNNATYAFVKEYPSAPATEEDPLVDVVYADGWSGAAYVTGDPVNVIVPEDAKYLFVYMNSNQTVFTPKEVRFK